MVVVNAEISDKPHCFRHSVCSGQLTATLLGAPEQCRSLKFKVGEEKRTNQRGEDGCGE